MAIIEVIVAYNWSTGTIQHEISSLKMIFVLLCSCDSSCWWWETTLQEQTLDTAYTLVSITQFTQPIDNDLWQRFQEKCSIADHFCYMSYCVLFVSSSNKVWFTFLVGVTASDITEFEGNQLFLLVFVFFTSEPCSLEVTTLLHQQLKQNLRWSFLY